MLRGEMRERRKEDEKDSLKAAGEKKIKVRI